MEALNEMIIGTITAYSGTNSTDKNGEEPIMVQCMAGIMPNRNVLSGTLAKRAGFEIGKTYLINVREVGFDKEFGRDFNFIKVKEITEATEIIRALKLLGNPVTLTIPRPEGFDEKYQRKTTAVEGFRTRRIQEGQYEPVSHRNYSHKTAGEIIEGTSYNNFPLEDLEKAAEKQKMEKKENLDDLIKKDDLSGK